MKLHYLSFILCFLLTGITPGIGQLLQNKDIYTKQDTLRGSLNAERTWWDVIRYDITVTPDYQNKAITGITSIGFKAVEEGRKMQIDLRQPLIIDSIFTKWRTPSVRGRTEYNFKKLSFTRNENVAWVDLTNEVNKGAYLNLVVYYHGKPREAINPPWDGGWIWAKDANGSPWMSVACQGLGASAWYPCKDHQSDEPDYGASLTMIVPDTLVAVGNGRLKEKINKNNGTVSYTWRVENPINNYDIAPYIGKYVNFSESYTGKSGNLDVNYWVLAYNLEKAKKHMMPQVKSMLTCFENWFGPYPFYEDGYKLVEAPHLGMEHQSAIAYGNGYKMGYSGKDWSGTGWGLKWDFLIVHESGHEWFGNNITAKDIADMWIHESFTNYSETLYTECQFGKEAANDYVIGTRAVIQNDIPVIGHYGVNKEGSGDMYWKGANMIHTIRQLIDDDKKFRDILRGLNKTFYHQTVTSKQIEDYFSNRSGINLSKIFDQYLRTTNIPTLEYKIKGYSISYRWTNCVPGFDLKIKADLGKDSKPGWFAAKEEWTTLVFADSYDRKTFIPDRNFYIKTKKVD